MGLNLKEPVGPLPLGAWIAVVGGGLGISWYSRRHAAAPAAAVTAPAVTDGAGTFTDAGTGDVPTGGTQAPIAPAPQTNEEWGHLATNTLIGHGFDPINADLCVRNYLNGKYLDVTCKADIDAALRYIGPPPIPVPPMEAAPTAPPVTTQPPVAPPSIPWPPIPTLPPVAPPPPPPAPPPPAPPPPPPPPSAPPPCSALAPGPAWFGYVAYGSRGPLVSTVQQRCADKGCSPGAIDGIFGPQTQAAVRCAQGRCGIVVDGVVGRQTACCLGM